MGYHVTILRAEAGSPRPIREAEVRAAVGRMGGKLAVVPRDDALWVVQPELGDESEILIVDTDEGELWASTVSDHFLALMIELAGHLGARVRGDELESYGHDGASFIHPDDQARHQEWQEQARRQARKPNLFVIFQCVMCGMWAVVLGMFLYRRFLGAG